MSKQVLSVTKTKKKTGRPKSAPTAVVRLPLFVLEAAEAWAKKQDDPPSRPEAIKQILGEYLKRRGFIS